MKKFLIHKNGNGPDEIEILDEENPFGVAVVFVGSGQKSYFQDRNEFMKYCFDTREEAMKIKFQILEAHLEFHKAKVDLYTKLLEGNK